VLPGDRTRMEGALPSPEGEVQRPLIGNFHVG
jgi:hypothetical protein